MRIGVTTSLITVFWLTFGTAGANQVWTVDRNGSGDFEQVKDAVVAAADGDVILVREGEYTFTTIDDKSLVIVAEETALPGPHKIYGVSVKNLAASRRVVVRGFQIDGFPFQFPQVGLLTTQNAGPIAVEDCQFTTEFGTHPVVANACTALFLTRCSLAGKDGFVTSLPVDFFPTPAIDATNSEIFLYDSVVEGGDGLYAFASSIFGPAAAGQDGAPAVDLDGGHLFASGSTLRGGNGGKNGSDNGVCLGAGDGAPGVRLTGNDPLFTRLDSLVGGGAGGAADGSCPGGVASPPIDVQSGSVATLAEAARSFQLSALAREGESISIHLTGQPGEIAKILFTVTHTGVYAPGLQGGLLVGVPTSLVVLGAIPPSGEITLSAPLPPNLIKPPFLGISIIAQTLMFGQGGLGVLGSPSVATIVDSGV